MWMVSRANLRPQRVGGRGGREQIKWPRRGDPPHPLPPDCGMGAGVQMGPEQHHTQADHCLWYSIPQLRQAQFPLLPHLSHTPNRRLWGFLFRNIPKSLNYTHSPSIKDAGRGLQDLFFFFLNNRYKLPINSRANLPPIVSGEFTSVLKGTMYPLMWLVKGGFLISPMWTWNNLYRSTYLCKGGAPYGMLESPQPRV